MSRLGIYAREITATRKLKRAAFFVVTLAVLASAFAHFTTPSVSFADSTVQSNNLPFTPTAIAASQDGTHIVAAQNNTTTQFYVSDNSGVDWTPVSVSSSTSAGPQQLVSTPDGETLFGVYGGRYYSSTDGGLNWTSTTGHNNHSFVMMAYAADSGVIYAVDWVNGPNQIVSSSDFGQTWTLVYTATRDINSVGVNADGTKLYDTEFDESDNSTFTNVSTNGGVTWTPIHQGDSSNFDFNVYANSDSSLLFISQFNTSNGSISSPLSSTDSGTTWQSLTVPPIGNSFYFSGLSAYNYSDADTGTTLYHVTADSGTPPIQPSVGINGQSPEGNPTIPAQPTFSGTSHPFAQVTVTVHSNPVTCSTTADSSGAWSCQLPQSLPAGVHTVVVDFVNPDASTAELGPYSVTVPSTETTPSHSSPTPTKPTPSNVVASDTPTTTDTNQTPSTTTTTPTPATQDVAEPTQTAATSSFNWWIVIAAVILAAIIIVIILIARRSRR
jgi:hypothetical protein